MSLTARLLARVPLATAIALALTTSAPALAGAPRATLEILRTLGGTDNYANGINATGQVVGEADTTGNAAQHASSTQTA